MSLRNQIREGFFDCSSDAYSIQYRLDDEVWIVERCRTLRAHRERLPALLKLPPVEAVAEAKANAGMVFEVSRVSGNSV